MTFVSYKPFSDAKTSLLCFQVIFSERVIEICFEFLSHDFLLCFAGFLQKVYYTFAKEPDRLYRKRVKEKNFAVVGVY